MAESLVHTRSRVAYLRASAWPRAERVASHVKGLPVLVRSMGAGPAIALLFAMDETRPLANDLVHWLVAGHPAKHKPVRSDQKISAFLDAYTRLDLSAARAVDEECLRFSESLKLISGALHAA